MNMIVLHPRPVDQADGTSSNTETWGMKSSSRICAQRIKTYNPLSRRDKLKNHERLRIQALQGRSKHKAQIPHPHDGNTRYEVILLPRTIHAETNSTCTSQQHKSSSTSQHLPHTHPLSVKDVLPMYSATINLYPRPHSSCPEKSSPSVITVGVRQRDREREIKKASSAEPQAEPRYVSKRSASAGQSSGQCYGGPRRRPCRRKRRRRGR